MHPLKSLVSSPLKLLATGLGVATTGAIEDYLYCLTCGETHEQALRSAAINGPIEGLTVGGCKWLGDAVKANKTAKLAKPVHVNSSTKAVEAVSESSKMVRVGRWMCRAEYDKMIKTGKVQMSPNGNTSYVAYPADINAFGKQAKPGSIYVEFDVDVSTIQNGGNKLWAQIPGPGSLHDRFNRSKGLQGISEIPFAKNIEIKGSK